MHIGLQYGFARLQEHAALAVSVTSIIWNAWQYAIYDIWRAIWQYFLSRVRNISWNPFTSFSRNFDTVGYWITSGVTAPKSSGFWPTRLNKQEYRYNIPFNSTLFLVICFTMTWPASLQLTLVPAGWRADITACIRQVINCFTDGLSLIIPIECFVLFHQIHSDLLCESSRAI